MRAQACQRRPLPLLVYTEVSTYVTENRLRLRYRDESGSTVPVKIGVVIATRNTSLCGQNTHLFTVTTGGSRTCYWALNCYLQNLTRFGPYIIV